MNTMDDLKNLVLQTLEAKGVLGQIRAKLRSCVFKVVEQEDANLKGNGNYLENPLAAKIMDDEEARISAELIRDFLQCHKMDYTLSIFAPECNLPADKKDNGDIVKKLGIAVDPSRPKTSLLQQMVRTMIQLQNGTAKLVPTGLAPPARAPEKKEQKEIVSFDELDDLLGPLEENKQVQKPEPRKVEQKKVEPPKKKEEKKKLPEIPARKVEKEPLPPLKPAQKKELEAPKVSSEFKGEELEEEEIQEEIMESIELDEPTSKNQRMFTDSGGLTGSASIGVDPSVDSLALEEYDYIEPIEKVSQP